jgi:hypothetical protein
MEVLAAHEVLLVPEQFSVIQRAIDVASAPTTIVVAPGVYPESLSVVDVPYLVIQSSRLSKRGVAIVGEHGKTAVLSVERSAVHLSGIEIRSNGRCRGVIAEQSSLNLQECLVAGNRLGVAAGLAVGAGVFARNSRVHLQKSALIGNVAESHVPVAGGGGLYAEDCRIEIAGCTIQGNAVYAPNDLRGGGIWSERSSMRLWRSRVTDNALYGSFCTGGGIYLAHSLGSQLGGSIVTGNSCHSDRGGGVFSEGDTSKVHIHRNMVVRQNHPNDVELG